MASQEWWMLGGGIVVLLWIAAVVYVALYPWFILAALRRMAGAQEAVARAVSNGPGQKDVSESFDALQYQMGRIATAMERIALGDAAPPRETPVPPPPPAPMAVENLAKGKEPMTAKDAQTWTILGILVVAGLVAWWLLAEFS